ncbi:hypothetical protein NDU88_008485 [Pleurodeles waltl]|uniref:Uncharacterized protein n=1 Tax=Pleurodeles waltl TaxID=8319 RepID=A0AAV7PT92_PLEWA|nr:hypothetical protein NDU88_008485 [Pleurodeles waltl]
MEGDFPGKTLANMLRRPWASAYVAELIDIHQERKSTPVGQLQIMSFFYSQLCSASRVPKEEELLAYLDNIQLHWLD